MSGAKWIARLRGLFAPVAPDAEPYVAELVSFDKPFAVSPSLFDELSVARTSAGREPDEVELRLDGFLLDPGLGPPVYLAGDGRIAWDGWYEWSKAAPSQRDAHASLVVGAKKTGVASLLELLPVRPDRAEDCLACAGPGWMDMLSATREPFQIVCAVCGGLGWQEAGEPPGPKTTELLSVLARVSVLLGEAGERHWATWVNTAAARIRAGDASGLDIVLDANGGMGSFNDLVLCEANGHDVAVDRTEEINAELDELRTTAWQLARDVRRVAEVG